VTGAHRPPGALATATQAGQPHFNAWVSLASPHAVEAMAAAGFSSVTLDVQHGFWTFGTLVEGIAAAALAKIPALVRLPLGGYGLGARALDAGATGLIAPMIDDAAEARLFADAVKFPPDGRRSWGPNRGARLSGLDRDGYVRGANALAPAFAMIETERALANVDAIARVHGVDGLYVGPNDLSVSLTGGSTVDPGHPTVAAALDSVLAAASRAGKPAAIFANTPAFAADYLRRGFAMVSLGSDLAFLRAGAERAIADTVDAPAIGAGAGG
jgi:4-hydroxy-2-oxoheptanedioate aldolase